MGFWKYPSIPRLGGLGLKPLIYVGFKRGIMKLLSKIT
jgi:hypothetical protein